MLPMLATPSTFTPTGPEWVHEVKWDGIRLLADCRGRHDIRLTTRNENDVTRDWPAIAGAEFVAPGMDVLFDGELVAFNAAGKPDFRAMRKGGKALYVIFDVLRLDGRDLTAKTWEERRVFLEQLRGGIDPGWHIPEVYDDGPLLWTATREQGLEGVVSKRRASTYRPGVRSNDWRKRAHRHRGTYVVGGWRPQVGTTDRLAALLVGEVTPAGLAYRGRVGSGITAQHARALKEMLVETTASPFVDEVPKVDARGTHWVEPTLMVEVDTHGVGYDRLRQPSFQGIRTDA